MEHIETLQKNQYIHQNGDTETFFSYGTPIATYSKNTRKITLDRDKWNYSRTTVKYLKIAIHRWTMLTYDTDAIRSLLNDGTFQIAVLS